MRSLFIPLAAAAVLIISACSSSQDAAQKTAVFGSDADPVFFSLERTPCFGACPVYVITVKRDGSATFEGRIHAPREGTYTAHVDEATMQKLLDRANSIGFFGMKDRYDGQITDIPSTIIRVNADGKDKKVIGRYQTPPTFKPFANLADSLLLPLPWAKVNNEK